MDIVGANCLRSPEYMLPIMEEMRAAVADTVHMAAQPVAFHGTDERPNFVSLPEFPYELEKITLPRTAMGEFAPRARDLGYNYIGSCCGSVAAHVREMARALGKTSSFQDHVLAARLCEPVAHREARLAASDDNGLDPFDQSHFLCNGDDVDRPLR